LERCRVDLRFFIRIDLARNTGVYEYPVLWAITSLAVALEAWKTHLRSARPAIVTKALVVA
jgi:hypothetical protein